MTLHTEQTTLNTGNLLSKGAPAGASDKVYLACSVKSTPGGFIVDLTSNTPVVWLNESWKAKYGHPGDFTVQQIQKNDASGLSLLSAGAFVWKGNQLVLLRKDQNAPSFAGGLTEPAGRCGELPSRTILKELNEELLMIGEASSLEFAIGWVGDALRQTEVVSIKQAQLAEKHFGLNRVTSVIANHVTPDRMGENVVMVRLDGIPVECIEGMSYWVEQNNTLEVRQSFLVPDEVTSFQDGEMYGRAVVLATPDAIRPDLKTPCLSNLVRMYV